MREEKLRAYLKGACAGRKYRVSGAELEQVLGINGTDLRKHCFDALLRGKLQL